jgi:molybdenum cofactor cytidylyltransferase
LAFFNLSPKNATRQGFHIAYFVYRVRQMTGKRVFAVVLAAGTASRFGTTKQLQDYQGMPLVTRAVRLAEEVCGADSLLVVGMDRAAVAAAAAPLQGFFTINSDFEQGLATSVSCGIKSICDKADAVLLLLADQPLITAAHLQDLIAACSNSADAIVATAYAGASGVPAIFPRRDFQALIELQGDRGGRSIIESAGDRLQLIEFEDASVDIDRPEDLPAAY